MVASVVLAPSSISDRAARVLERVEHRCAISEQDRELVFRTRYIAYARQKLIDPRSDGRIYDEIYDRSPNHYNIMTFMDGEFVSTFRIHVGRGEGAVLPSLTAFHDVLYPYLQAGRVVVDPTRIAAKLEYAGRFPELPYLTIRAAWLAAEHFKADVITSTCIGEHQAFYKRVFGFESLCAPRQYPNVHRPIACMSLEYRAHKERVESRYPLFRSTEAERKSIFGASSPLWIEQPTKH